MWHYLGSTSNKFSIVKLSSPQIKYYCIDSLERFKKIFYFFCSVVVIIKLDTLVIKG